MRHPIDELKALVADEASRRLGSNDLEIDSLGGHASYRLYYRVRAKGRSLMVMELAGDPLASEEATSGERPSELPFITVQRYLASGGLPVPQIYAYLEQHGLVLLEDLGSQTLEDVVLPLDARARRQHYERAIALLIDWQRFARAKRDPLCHNRGFDVALLRWELDHFREWLLETERGARLAEGDSLVVANAFQAIAAELAAQQSILAHRDFQSRNLMVQGVGADARLRLIDFQDALLAPPPYDLVALLRDSYVDLGLPLVDALVEHYLDAGGAELSGIGPSAFRRLFWLQTVQRKLKDAGRFVFIDRVKGNASFLVHVPVTLQYVAEAFARLPELAQLQQVLGRAIPELAKAPHS